MTSKIKVDNIENQCGGAVVTKCGGTTTISGTVVKSNTLQASDAGNIISQSGTTITLGASGDTINLASGASQSGFGRTGTVDWQTSIKTSTITAVNGEGYFVNTSGGAITANLPAGVVGAIVSFKDYAQTFDTNALTISANGSEKIEGQTFDLILNTEGIAVTLVYGDATKGWQAVNSNEIINVESFITATGGCITTSGNCKIHTFTGPGTFCVSTVSNITAANNEVSYMVVAGGGGGGSGYSISPLTGNASGAGAGAGGFRETKSPVTPYTASPLDGQPSAPNRITVTATSFPITVGGGGAAPPSNGTAASDGSNSVFSTIISAGGGKGGANKGNGGTGGSGGGRGGEANPGTGAAGNTPPTSPAQGRAGGAGGYGGPNYGSGGGGGATTDGGNGSPSVSGCGGAGATTSISATPTAYAGGGGGSSYCSPTTSGGGTAFGGGAGAKRSPASAAVSGTDNTGGGAGGGVGGAPSPLGNGGAGGSGIVIIRYKFQ